MRGKGEEKSEHFKVRQTTFTDIGRVGHFIVALAQVNLQNLKSDSAQRWHWPPKSKRPDGGRSAAVAIISRSNRARTKNDSNI